MEIALLTLDSKAERAKVSTSGFEYIYIVKGVVQYELDNETFELEEGDSLFFDGNIPHVPRNGTDAEAVLLVIYLITMN